MGVRYLYKRAKLGSGRAVRILHISITCGRPIWMKPQARTARWRRARSDPKEITMATKHPGLQRLFKSAGPLSVIAALLTLGGVYDPGILRLPWKSLRKRRKNNGRKRLYPLLEGRQEFWAIGEFVHIGPPAVPVLVNALNNPSRRIRLNAIEAIYLIKDKSAISALNAVAGNPEEIPAVREKALRVAIRLDPENAMPALEAMAKDRDEAIRNTVSV